MNTNDTSNDYPVELTPPDISAYASGNTGIPYVWRFESGQPGPNVMISAVVHGNEPCGAIALDWLLENDTRPECGSLTLAFVNVAAYQSFDPSNPNASRWIDQDMNRVWSADVLEGDQSSIELRRAREIRPAVEDIDFLLDIHTMQHYSPPMMMSGRHQRAKDLAAKVGTPELVIGDFGHAEGRRMRDYQEFDAPGGKKTALLVECGQHWSANAGHLAKETSARFLRTLGVVPEDFAAEFVKPNKAQNFFTVKEAVTIHSEAGFTFTQKFSGGEIIPKAGTVIGHDGEKPVATPYNDVMLVMPSRRLWKGLTAVRFATMD